MIEFDHSLFLPHTGPKWSNLTPVFHLWDYVKSTTQLNIVSAYTESTLAIKRGVIVLPIYVRVYDEKKSKDPYENQPGFWRNPWRFHKPQAIWANDSINRSTKTDFKIGQAHISWSKFKHNNYRYMHGIRCCFLFLTVKWRVVFFNPISGSQVLFRGWKSTCPHVSRKEALA